MVSIPNQAGVSDDFIISSWHKAEGDLVEEGDLLFTYETDKAAIDEVSPVKGSLKKIYYKEGDVVPFGENICEIEEKGRSARTGCNNTPSSVTKETRVFITPRAKRLANELGLDYMEAIPTGSGGKLVEKDILALKKRRDTEEVLPFGKGLYEVLPLNPVRQSIGAAMMQSLSTTAQVTLHRSFNAENLLACRDNIKKTPEFGEIKITLNDLIVYAVSRNIKKYRELNANFIDGKIYAFEEVHLGIAVDLDSGVVVPTLFNADSKSLAVISKEIKSLVQKSREGSLKPQDYKGSGFTISNLGNLGVEYFTPIINPPQTGILGVNTICYKTRLEAGRAVTYPAMGLSLTFDHRVLDGGRGARFLKDLATWLEQIEGKLG